MRDPAELWTLRAHSVRRARKAVRNGEPEGLHDLRVALRRVAATSGALGPRAVAREAKALANSVSDDRQLEVDRRLLARIGKLGHLSPDATTALAARWEKVAERGGRRIARVAGGRALRDLLKKLERLSRKKPGHALDRLERARRKAEAVLQNTQALEAKDDHDLHRYRMAVKKARYLAEDLAELGLRRFTSQIEREKTLQEALGRWNDLRLFRGRLAESRNEAEERGAITLALELERLLAALETTIANVRRAAVDASRESAEVVPLSRGRRLVAPSGR